MSTKERIIDAATSIVREQGVARLTLDEAAKVAGVSKGGVLYHFKSKDDLIRGMVDRLLEQCEALHQEYYRREAEGPYRWARSVVRACFDPNGPANDPVGGALLAAMAVNPQLVNPMKELYTVWLERVRSDSPDFERAALVCMAMDGMMFEKLMGFPDLGEEQTQKTMQAALDLLK